MTLFLSLSNSGSCSSAHLRAQLASRESCWRRRRKSCDRSTSQRKQKRPPCVTRLL